MKYITLTLGYMFKNIHKIIIFAVFPAILFALFFDLVQLYELFDILSTSNEVLFWDIFSRLSLFGETKWWIILISFVMFILAIGILIASLDRHMKIGKFNFKFYQKLDDIILIVFPIMVVLVAFTELVAFLFSCVVALFALFVPAVAMGGVFIGFAVVFFLVWSAILLFSINWTPAMFVKGYNMAAAFGSSIRSVSKRFFSMFLAWLFGIAVCIPFIVVAEIFFGDYVVIVNAICYIFIILYLACFTMTSFYENSQLERRDIKNKKII